MYQEELRVLDLFAGAGGFSKGLEDAGFEIIAANEVDKWAAETYAYNHPSVEMLNCDINSISKHKWRKYRGEVDIVVGGPPCQGFSVSGKRQYGIHKETNLLVHNYIDVVKEVSPSYFVLENVRGFTSATIEGRNKALDYILSELKEAGYHIYHKVLQAYEYGVPQSRSRLFVIGSKMPFGKDPFPKKTHSLDPNDGLKPCVSVLEAISDLPVIHAKEGKNDFQPYTVKAENSFQRKMRINSKGVCNHEAMKHSPRLVERFKTIPQGGKGYDFGRKNCKKESVTVYKSNNQRLVEDLPSLCITANFQSNFVHPTLHRNLTAREGARLMSFPDNFVFKGKRTLMSASLLRAEGRDAENFLSQYNQIGNSVPPLLAKAIGKSLIKAIQAQYVDKNIRPGTQIEIFN